MRIGQLLKTEEGNGITISMARGMYQINFGGAYYSCGLSGHNWSCSLFYLF